MELIVLYAVYAILVILWGGRQGMLVAILSALRSGDVVRDPVPDVPSAKGGDDSGYTYSVQYHHIAVDGNIVWSADTQEPDHNCTRCGSESFVQYRGIMICSYCRGKA